MPRKADDVFRALLTPAQQAEAQRLGQEMLSKYTLQQLRKAADLTQAEVAGLLDKNQVAISQTEKRKDMLVSTLRRHVEAMGGQLRLIVEFEGREPVLLTGVGDEDIGAAQPSTEVAS